MGSNERCCICLDKATRNQSLQLIDCGCEGSWFHNSCEMEWMKNLEDFEYFCPTCRRPVPLITNYSFSIYSGSHQKYLWFVGALVSIEHVICFDNRIVWVLPWQSMAFLAIPLILPSQRPLPFYLNHVLIHNIFNAMFAYMTYYDRSGYDLYFEFCKSIGILHIVSILLVSIVPCGYAIDPLYPYAISREVKHRRELAYQLLPKRRPTP